MTFKRRMYYRWKRDKVNKKKSIVIEGKAKGKTVYLMTLPTNPEKLIRFLQKASFFPQDKAKEISKNILRLDYKTRKSDDDD